MQFTRRCPVCDVNIYYTTKYNCRDAENIGSRCKECLIRYGYKIIQKPKKYVRRCPRCKKDVFHTTKNMRNKAERFLTLCKPCSVTGKGVVNHDNLIHKCPICGREKKYPKSQIGQYNYAVRDNRMCMKCSKTDSTYMRLYGMTKNNYMNILPKKERYYRDVWNMTRKQPLKDMDNYLLRGSTSTSGSYSLDHIVPISYGFDNNIPITLMGSMDNLQFIPSVVNSSKHTTLIIDSISILKKWGYYKNKS